MAEACERMKDGDDFTGIETIQEVALLLEEDAQAYQRAAKDQKKHLEVTPINIPSI